jgi:hypothetical protein
VPLIRLVSSRLSSLRAPAVFVFRRKRLEIASFFGCRTRDLSKSCGGSGTHSLLRQDLGLSTSLTTTSILINLFHLQFCMVSYRALEIKNDGPNYPSGRTGATARGRRSIYARRGPPPVFPTPIPCLASPSQDIYDFSPNWQVLYILYK